jgi:putative FmdB family regulatory protein
MPTYEYLCRNCGFRFEELQSIKDEPLVHCPECNTDSLARVMGAGSGIIFKGSGFYLTDYKKSNSTVSKKDEVKKTDGASGSTSAPPPAPKDSSTSSEKNKS